MLLHDTGKGGVGGQEKAGARAARAGLRAAWAWSAREIELVAWLVEHHLVMSDFAQKRDVADPAHRRRLRRHRREPRAAAAAAGADRRRHPRRRAGRLERLEGPAAARTLRRDRDRVPRRRGCRRRRHCAPPARGHRLRRPHRAGRGRPGRRAAWATAMEDAYFAAFTPAEQMAHAALARRGPAQGGAAAEAEIRADRNVTEVLVAARDREGLFADLARRSPASAAMWSARASSPPRAARRWTSSIVQDVTGQPVRQRQPARLGPAGRRRWRPPPRRAAAEPSRAAPRDLGRAAAFAIAPAVTIDNEASADADGDRGLGPRPAGPAGRAGADPGRREL